MPAKKIFEKINKGFVQKYKTALKDGQKLSDASINRRFSALSKFFDWAEKKGHIVKNPLEKKSTAHSKKGQQQNKTKPSASWYSHYRAFVKYGAIVSTGALVILILNRQITLSDLKPENLSRVATETIASYSPWIVQFEGKLFNPNNTPITTTSTVIFSIYETEEGGNSLWSSKEWNLLPDENGVFSAQLGDTSRGDNQISSDLFFQHDQLYIGTTVKGKGESKPRLPLSTASNIVNSMHLDGYQAAIEAKPLTVPVISESGELILASKNPKLTSTDGTLKIEGQAITITTPLFSSGDITMAPDGEGTVNMRISASEGNSFNIKNANISSGNLLYGYVGNDTTGYNLLELQSGATPQSQFTVDAKGNTRVGGNLTVTKDTILGTSSLDNIKLQGTVTNTTGTSVFFDDNIEFVGTQSITTSLGDLVLAPAGNIDIQKSIVNTSTNNDGNVYVDDNFKIHGGMYSRSIVNEGSLDSDTITTIGDATFGDSTSDQVTVSGNLTVSGTISGSITGTINPSFTQGSVAFADSSGNLAEDNASFFWDDTNNRLGIGTASPSEPFHISSTVSSGGTQAVSHNEVTITYATGDSTNRHIRGTYSELTSTSSVNLTGTKAISGYNSAHHSGSGTISDLIATETSALITGNGTVTDVWGLQSYAGIEVIGDASATNVYGINNTTHVTNLVSGAASVDNAYGFITQVGTQNLIGGTPSITNAYNVYLKNFAALSGYSIAGTITNNYGLYIETPTRGSTLNYSIYSAGGDNYFGGDVGIGATSPQSLLHVGASGTPGNADGTNDLYVLDDVEIDGTLYADGGITQGGDLTITKADPTIILDTTTATDTDFWIGVQEDAGGDDDDVFQIGDGTTPGTNPFLSILTGGNVGIGTSDPGFILDVQTDAASSYAGYFFNDGNNANRYGIEVQAGNDDGVTGTTYYLTALDGDGGAVGYVENAAGTFQVTDVSDARTKTNIVDTTLSGLDIINNLRVVDFNRIQDPNGTKHHGLIAQEVEDVYPYMVSQTPDGSLLTIAKEQLIPVLTKAVQEQQEQFSIFNDQFSNQLSILNEKIEEQQAAIEVFAKEMFITAKLIAENITAGTIKTTSLVTDSAQVLNTLIATRIETDEIISPIVETEEIRMQNVEFRIQNKADETVLSVNDQGAFTAKKEVIAPKGSFGELTTDKLITDTIEAQSLNARRLTLDADATISGTLFANDITTKDGKLSSLIERVQSFFDQEETSALEEQIAQDLTSSKESSFSALLTKLEEAPVYTSDSDVELVEDYSELFQQELATQYENGLTPSSILVDATLYISGATIDSGTNTLYLQRFARGSVNIMNGQLVIDVNGDVFINRNLSVKGTVATNSISPLPNGDLTIDLSQPIYENESTTSASFAQLLPEELQKQLNKGKPSRFGKIMIKGVNGENVATIDASGSASFIGDIAAKNGQFDKLIIASNQASPSAQLVSSSVVSNASTGSMVLAAGKTTVVIKSLQITNDSLIYLTPISDTNNKVLYIAKKRASEKTFDGIGYFEVSIDAPIARDIEFNWWIIN